MDYDFVKITYIYHDCFLIETAGCVVVIDYWKDPADCSGNNGNIPAMLADISENKPLYVLVTHFHKDHFNPEIFSWARHFKKVNFIISKDVRRHARHLLSPDSLYRGIKPDVNTVHAISKGESFGDELLEVKAYGSTDIGNSYAVCFKSSGRTLFHAGDLNCWAWRDESTQEEVVAAEKAFRSELDFISRDFKGFDVVLFPVDSRIGSGYAQGASEFVRKFSVGTFLPMHFTLADSEDERRMRIDDALAFSQYAIPKGEYVGLTAPHDFILRYF